MKIEQINGKKYIQDKWVVEIVEGECCGIPTTDVWLYHKDYCVKELVFGVEGKANHEEFDIIKIIEDSKEFYKEEYIKEKDIEE